VNRAPRETLLRVPGFGTKTVQRILAGRRHRSLRYEDLQAMGAVMGRARAFVQLPGWTPRGMLDAGNLRARFKPPPEQLALF
jgi:predicted DNA-binding helix-hairpin-helix protein